MSEVFKVNKIVADGKEYELSRGGVTVKFAGLDAGLDAATAATASELEEMLKKAAMESMKKSRISSIKVDTEPFSVTDESDKSRIHDLLYGDWAPDATGSITVAPSDYSDHTIKVSDPVTSVERSPVLDRYIEVKEELDFYKEKYHSWFSDKDLDKDSFKSLPSDLSREIMGTFCVDTVWDLFNRVFKTATPYDKNKLASGSSSQFIEVRRMVDRAVKRFKLDKKRMTSLLRRVIAESKEFYIDKDKDWLGSLFFEMSEKQFKEIVGSKFFLASVTYKGEDFSLYITTNIREFGELTGTEDDYIKTIRSSFRY